MEIVLGVANKKVAGTKISKVSANGILNSYFCEQTTFVDNWNISFSFVRASVITSSKFNLRKSNVEYVVTLLLEFKIESYLGPTNEWVLPKFSLRTLNFIGNIIFG